MRLLKSYLRDTTGNFAVMTSLGFSVVLLGVGAAVEVNNMTRVKNELQSQVDIATLAAAGTSEPKKNDYANLAFDVMVENGYLEANGKPSAVQDGSYLNVSAQIKYEGMFTHLFGSKDYTVSASAQSTLPSEGKVDLVLVLDNTSSMSVDGKLDALKDGAKNIITTVQDGGSGSQIGIVPFARYINIGDESGSWLDKPTEYDVTRTWEQATHSGGTCRTETQTRTVDGIEQDYETSVCEGQTTTYETQSRVVDARFQGCVGTSDEPNHFDPISPSNRVPGLLDSHRYEETGLSRDIDTYCPMPIRPLDDDYSGMISHVNAMYGTDVTNIPSGLLWGERLLDRTSAFKQSPKQENVRQVMILMTDGKNTAEIRSGSSYEASFQAPPYLYHANNETAVPKADANTTFLCDRIKDKGVELFTISFRIDDAAAKSLVKDCATSTSHSFDADSNASLIEAFDKIGKNLQANVRLTR